MIKEVDRVRRISEHVTFEIPADLIPDRKKQYGSQGKMYRPQTIYALYTKAGTGEWKVDRVSVKGLCVLKSGKTSTASHVEKLYGMPSEKSWLTDLVRENMPQD